MGSVKRATWRQYLGYLGINVVVSAVTVVLVLSLWNRGGGTAEVSLTPTLNVIAQVASAVPTVTPTVPPTPTPAIYTVRSGDTLMDIALKLDVPIEALMAANRLTNPDAISAGQVLVVPSIVGPASSGPSPSVISTSTPTPPTPVPSANVVINGVEGAGELETETVRLLNSGGEVAMAGWTLEDGTGHRYQFPAFTFYSTGAVDVHSRSGTDTSIDLFWGLDEPVWLPGRVITLSDQTGRIVSTFQIPEN